MEEESGSFGGRGYFPLLPLENNGEQVREY